MYKNKPICALLVIYLVITMLAPAFSVGAGAADESTASDRIIVSLGDSYSSGEGIEPFYGQDKKLKDKVEDPDWLAHRSEKSWPGMLKLPGVEGTMAQNRGTHWFFAASSGATTKHIKNVQEKKYNKKAIGKEYKDTYELPAQKEIFKELGDKKADYVTMTFGGNDAGFADIIVDAVKCGIPLFEPSILHDKINATWDEFFKDGGIREKLENAYNDIYGAAGEQAKLIVAGYPRLLDPEGSLAFFSEEEAETINQAVTGFNNAIENLVNSCSTEIPISFVSVEEAFDGHGAYAKEPYINKVILGTKGEDLKTIDISSAYSMHPNEKGAVAYAQCVQAEINRLEGGDYDTYAKNFSIFTYGYDGNLHNDYTITIEGQRKVGFTGLFTKSYKKEITVDEAAPVPINLGEGTYTITVSDGVNKPHSKDITVSKESTNISLVFSTKFGYEGDIYEDIQAIQTTSEERDVVLVLDASGSMAGTPLEETKNAATKFISTVLKEDASIGVVTYDDTASMMSDFSMSETDLIDVVNDMSSGGGTNMDAGLKMAEGMLSNSNAKKKIIVLMSDGEPNSGRVGSELIDYADSLKDQGIYIYTLGFFDALGSEKAEAQQLMKAIASEGRHYEVVDADDLVFFFGDIADQINGQEYVFVQIACPVDVMVSYDGETLTSEEDDFNDRTSFGTLFVEDIEDSDEKMKTLHLKAGNDYTITIEGTGRGTMDYTIGYMDENGDYSDMRKFKKISITRKTMIETSTERSDKTVLNVDEDGDGRFDLKYVAEENGYGELVDYTEIIYIALGAFGVVLLIVAFVIVKRKIKRRKAT